MEFNAWSFTRRAMSYGEIIQFDSDNLQRDTETHNAVMDAKAAELSKEIDAHLQSRIASLEAERGKAVELLREAIPFLGGWNGYVEKREKIEAFLALVGGEVKNG